MPALVAKSYKDLEQLTEPYEVNGKMYVKVRMKSGLAKQVRAYTEAEYKRYNPEVKIIKKGKPRWEVLGFGEKKFIWIFKGDTYSVIDWFRVSPCRFARPWGWYLSSNEELPEPLPAGIEPIKLEWDKVSFNDELIPEKDIQQIVDSMIYDAGASQWMGQIGDKLDLTLVCDKATPVLNNYGESTFHVFHDEAGNIYTWSTTAKTLIPGNKYEMTGTIKSLDIYRNRKQNTLTRCRVIKEFGEN